MLRLVALLVVVLTNYASASNDPIREVTEVDPIVKTISCLQ